MADYKALFTQALRELNRFSVPGVGTFVREEEPARIDANTHEIYPPKTVFRVESEEKQVISLYNFIAEKESVSRVNAEKLAGEMAHYITEYLKLPGGMEIGGIGIFSREAGGKVSFAHGTGEPTDNTYGLQVVQLGDSKPQSAQTITSTPLPKPRERTRREDRKVEVRSPEPVIQAPKAETQTPIIEKPKAVAPPMSEPVVVSATPQITPTAELPDPEPDVPAQKPKQTLDRSQFKHLGEHKATEPDPVPKPLAIAAKPKPAEATPEPKLEPSQKSKPVVQAQEVSTEKAESSLHKGQLVAEAMPFKSEISRSTEIDKGSGHADEAGRRKANPTRVLALVAMILVLVLAFLVAYVYRDKLPFLAQKPVTKDSKTKEEVSSSKSTTRTPQVTDQAKTTQPEASTAPEKNPTETKITSPNTEPKPQKTPEKTTLSTAPVEENNLSGTQYHIIVGSFPNKEKAEAALKDWEAKGYSPKLLPGKTEGSFRLSAYHNTDKAIAKTKLEEVKADSPQAWLLKEP